MSGRVNRFRPLNRRRFRPCHMNSPCAEMTQCGRPRNTRIGYDFTSPCHRVRACRRRDNNSYWNVSDICKLLYALSIIIVFAYILITKLTSRLSTDTQLSYEYGQVNYRCCSIHDINNVIYYRYEVGWTCFVLWVYFRKYQP